MPSEFCSDTLAFVQDQNGISKAKSIGNTQEKRLFFIFWFLIIGNLWKQIKGNNSILSLISPFE
jgi:hypothetical protein